MPNPHRDALLRTAILAFNSRDYSSARRACEAALIAFPDDPSLHLLFAKVYIEQGKPKPASKQALAAFRHCKGCRLEEILDISWTLIVTGEQEQARELLLRFDPGNKVQMRGFWGAARQLGMLELHEQALALMNAISDPMLVNANTWTLKGHLLSVTGDFAGSMEALENALRIAPYAPLPHLLLSRLNIREGRAERIDRLRALIDAGAMDLDQRAMLEYALFGELDAVGDLEPAWDSLASGAAARHEILPYDARAEDSLFDTLISATAGMSARAAGPGTDATPIFIVGLPRSGTTLLERVLGNHPDIRPCGELTTLLQQSQWVEDRLWPGMLDERTASRMQTLDADLLRKRYLQHVAWRLDGKRFFTDKTPGNFMHVASILRSMPHAKVIHLHRNPADACFSNLRVLFAPDAYPYSYSIDGLVNHHANYRRLMAHWHRVFPGRVLDVSYEAMVADPQTHSNRILEFCGLSRVHHITDVTSNMASVSTESRGQVREPIHRRNVGAWKRYERWLRPMADRLPAD